MLTLSSMTMTTVSESNAIACIKATLDIIFANGSIIELEHHLVYHTHEFLFVQSCYCSISLLYIIRLQAWLFIIYPMKVTMKLLDNNLTLFCHENLWSLLAEDSAVYFMTAVATKGSTQVSWERLSYLAF